MSEKMEKLGRAALSVVTSLAEMPTATGTAAKVAISAKASLCQLVNTPALRRVPHQVTAAVWLPFRTRH